MMERRAFIPGLGGAAAWPLAARGQQPDQMQRVAVLMGIAETDLDSGARVTAFQQSLNKLGWMPGRTVIVADGTPALRAFYQTRTGIPIVFTIVSEPVAAGFVQSLARPGVTGFTNLEPSVGAKWLELLKEVAPQVARVGLMFNLKPLLFHSSIPLGPGGRRTICDPSDPDARA